RLDLDANTFSFSFVLPSLVPGLHTLTAVATDNFGATATSAIVRLTVNSRPFVAITAPASGASFQEGADIGIIAAATNTIGAIARVEFFAGTDRLGVSLLPPYRAALSNAAGGTYELTARATSVFGVVATSAPVIV